MILTFNFPLLGRDFGITLEQRGKDCLLMQTLKGQAHRTLHRHGICSLYELCVCVLYTFRYKRLSAYYVPGSLCTEGKPDLASVLKKPAFSEGTGKQRSRPIAQTDFRGSRQEGTASLTSEG